MRTGVLAPRVLLALAPAMVPPRLAEAQLAAAPDAAPAALEGGGMLVLALLATIIGAIFVIVKVADRWHRRDAEGIDLQVRLSRALMKDARLAILPLLITPHVPFWRGSQVWVELHGTVPSQELREAARQLVAEELARVDRTGRVEDRVIVLPRTLHRPA